MASVGWAGANGLWVTASGRSPNTVPRSWDDVFISVAGGYFVTLTISIDTNSPTGDALLEFASGSIMAIASGAQLGPLGSQARIADASDLTHNGALTGLASDAGDFELQSEGSVALGSGLTVTGSVNIDTDFKAFGSTLSVGGDLSNSGTINLGRTDQAGGSALSISGAPRQRGHAQYLGWRDGNAYSGESSETGTAAVSVAAFAERCNFPITALGFFPSKLPYLSRPRRSRGWQDCTGQCHVV